MLASKQIRMQLVSYAWPPMPDCRLGKRSNSDKQQNLWIMQQGPAWKGQQATLRVKIPDHAATSDMRIAVT